MTSQIAESGIREDVTPDLAEPGDHERFAHYVTKEDLEAALFSGVPATALCGKKWLPTRDPASFPVCPTCKELYGMTIDDLTPEMEG